MLPSRSFERRKNRSFARRLCLENLTSLLSSNSYTLSFFIFVSISSEMESQRVSSVSFYKCIKPISTSNHGEVYGPLPSLFCGWASYSNSSWQLGSRWPRQQLSLHQPTPRLETKKTGARCRRLCIGQRVMGLGMYE